MCKCSFLSLLMLSVQSNLLDGFSHLSAALALSFPNSTQSLPGEWQFPLSTTSLNNFHNIFQWGGRFSSHGSRPSQIRSWTRKTLTSNSKMLHTKGNFVNTTRPGCEGCTALVAEYGAGLATMTSAIIAGQWGDLISKEVNGLSLTGDCTSVWCLQPHTPKI